jgi:hypothetical protein
MDDYLCIFEWNWSKLFIFSDSGNGCKIFILIPVINLIRYLCRHPYIPLMWCHFFYLLKLILWKNITILMIPKTYIFKWLSVHKWLHIRKDTKSILPTLYCNINKRHPKCSSTWIFKTSGSNADRKWSWWQFFNHSNEFKTSSQVIKLNYSLNIESVNIHWCVRNS